MPIPLVAPTTPTRLLRSFLRVNARDRAVHKFNVIGRSTKGEFEFWLQRLAIASWPRSSNKRRNNIARLWAEDGVFVDHNSRYEGHSGIDHAVAVLIEKFPTFTFTERGELQAFNGIGHLMCYWPEP